MDTLKKILSEELVLFKKSIFHFEEICMDIKGFIEHSEYSKEQLYLLDTFAARFARCIDVYENKILKTVIAIIGESVITSMDLFNRAESLNMITSARSFYKLKQLRNRIVHEYTESDWNKIAKEAFQKSAIVFESAIKTIAFCQSVIDNKDYD